MDRWMDGSLDRYLDFMLAVDQELRVIAKDSNDDLGQSSIGHIAKSLGLGDLAHVHCQPRVS